MDYGLSTISLFSRLCLAWKSNGSSWSLCSRYWLSPSLSRASCDSLLNISQYSNDVFDVIIACKNILGANVTSVLTAFQTMNPSLAVKFSAIHNEINRLSAPISMQWPKIFENMLQTHGDCALLLQRCTLYVFVSNVLFTSAQIRILWNYGYALHANEDEHLFINSVRFVHFSKKNEWIGFAISFLLWMQVIGESTLLNVLVNRVLLLLFSICSCKKQNVGDPVPLFSGRSDEI